MTDHEVDGQPLVVGSLDWSTFEIPLDKKYWVHFYFDGPSQIERFERIRHNRFHLLYLVILEPGFQPTGDSTARNELTLLTKSPQEGYLDIGAITFE